MSELLYTDAGSTGAQYRLRINGGNLELLRDGVVVRSQPLASVDAAVINAGSGEDTLVIDELIALPGGVTFNGGLPVGLPGDVIVISANSDSQTFTYANATDGTIVFASGGTTSVYNFTGIDPLTNTGTVTDLIYNLPGNTDTQLEDDGTGGNDTSRVRDALAGYETTTFTHPTGSLTINGQSTDTVTLNLVDSLGSASLVATAGTVSVSAGVTAGSISLQSTIGAMAVTSTLTATSVALAADEIEISAAINATGTITLGPVTVGTAVRIGGAAGSGFVIDATELSFLTSAATLAIGKDLSGTTTAGAITVAVGTVANSTLNLFSTAGVSQTGALSVGGGTGALNVTAGGPVILTGGAVIGSIGGSTTSGDFSLLRTSAGTQDLTANAITTGGGDIAIRNFDGDLTVAGAFNSGGGDIALGSNDSSGSTVTLNANVNAGTGTAYLFGSGGANQAGGVITADNLAAENFQSGNIALTANNAVSGRIVLDNPFGNVSFTNTSAFAIGGLPTTISVAGLNFGLDSLGIRTAAGGSTTLTTGGNVTQSAGASGTISTGTLNLARIGAANPDVTLDNAGNDIDNVGTVSLGTGAFTLANTGNLTISGAGTAGDYTVTTAGGALTVSQSIAGGDVTLQSSGDLGFTAGITANAANGIVSLTSTAGSINQGSLGGTLSGAELLAKAATNVDFSTGGHSAGGSGFAATATSGYVAFLNNTAVQIDSVNGTNGVTAAGPVFLGVSGGNVTQTASGTITAGSLGLFASTGSIVLDQANNITGNFAVVSTPSGNVTFHNTGNLNIGTVGPLVVSGGGSFSANGISASTAAGRFVSLTSDSGTIAQDAGAGSRILGGELRLQTTNQDVTLANTSNQLTGLGATSLGTGLLTLFDSAGGLSVNGAVTAGAVAVTASGATSDLTVASGGSIVSSGATTLTAGRNITLGASVSAMALALNASGTTNLNVAINGGVGSLTTDTAGSTAINGGAVTTSGAQAFNDAVTLGANTALTSTGTGNLSLVSAVNGAFNLDANTAGTTTFGGAVGATTALTSVTTDAAGTTAINGGTVTTTGAQTYNDAVTLGAATALSSTGAGAITFNSTVDSGGFGLTVNTAGAGLFSGAVSGAGAFTKGGAGTTTLAAANAYSGATTVDAGTLMVNGSIANSATTVNAGTLGGNGTTGAVNVASGGTLSPGASAGNLTVGNLSLVSGAMFAIELGGTTAGSTYDQLDVNGTVALGGATLNLSLIGGFTPSPGTSFIIIDNDGADAVTGTFGGLAEGADFTAGGNLFSITYQGGNGNDVALVLAVNDGPLNTIPGPQSVAANEALAIGGLAVSDPDSGAAAITTTLAVAHGTLTVAPAGGAAVGGSGTAAVTLTGTAAQIAATLTAASDVIYTPTHDFFGTDTLTVTTNDGGNTGTGGAQSDTDQVTINVGTIVPTTNGDDSITAPAGAALVQAGAGNDTITFGFALVDATVTYSGNLLIIDGPSSHTVTSGLETFVFTDGTVDNNDGHRLIDDLFYYSRHHDVWIAHVDADAHYNAVGWHEGRDPSAFFDTSIYLSANPDVAASGANPLTHYATSGWMEGRVPSLEFGTRQYLDANPDVKAANVDPLFHFLVVGASEGRQPIKPTELVAANGFDFVHYLANNPDVAAAGVDPLWHFQNIGWQEGRDPNALFDTGGYLATYTDVAAAHINPLDHYNLWGWKEGRDPSVGFDTTAYLAAYSDVAAAHVNPLSHFLQSGIHEGRSAFNDGVWG